ncbi:EF-hand domain-containing protein [Pelagibacteraceae bacterium]|nr:EF-hand domain-containing protein [Pelagibacteraceae bacterium]
MVWIKTLFLFLLLYSSFVFSNELNELNEEEGMLFNFVDLNNDGVISYEEIEQSLNLLFQIIDLNQDNKISKNEINELKEIIESLR